MRACDLIKNALILTFVVIGALQLEAQNPIKRSISKEVVASDTTENGSNKEIEVCKYPEQMPSFPGGNAAMYRFLAENLQYPAEAAEKRIQGKVFVRFVVKKDGSVSDIEVVRSKDPSLDAEAVRVVGLMKGWTPGRNNGMPVNVYYTLPITFKLNSEE